MDIYLKNVLINECSVPVHVFKSHVNYGPDIVTFSGKSQSRPVMGVGRIVVLGIDHDDNVEGWVKESALTTS
jgi:hypothetical protein